MANLTFDDAHSAALLNALGLPSNTTDLDTIVATVTDAATASTTADAAPSAVAAAARRHGLEVLDTDTAEALRRDAAEGRRMVAAAARDKVVAAVGDAIAKGKITPSQREHWEKLVTADAEMANVLAAVPDETAVPISAIGHGVDGEESSASDGVWFH